MDELEIYKISKNKHDTHYLAFEMYTITQFFNGKSLLSILKYILIKVESQSAGDL